jgi:hypothetical protein
VKKYIEKECVVRVAVAACQVTQDGWQGRRETAQAGTQHQAEEEAPPWSEGPVRHFTQERLVSIKVYLVVLYL